MPVIFPNKNIASRWHGALAARLRREPLELFLSAHSIDPAPPGPSCVGEQLSAGALVFLDAMLSHHRREAAAPRTPAQHYVIANSACAVSEALARLIGNPASWRIAALVSAARALTPSMGTTAAAWESVAAVRTFRVGGSRLPIDEEILRIESAVTHAVASTNEAAFDDVVRFMAWRLEAGRADAVFRALAPPSLSYDSHEELRSKPNRGALD